MTSKQKLLVANVAVLIVAALAVWLLFRSSAAEPPAGRRPAPPTAPPRVTGAAGAPSSPGALPGPDEDPAGPLLLEGQVLGPDGQPADGATVLLGSRPPRTAITEADGSFSFDRLAPRSYQLTAHRGDAIAGPVERALRPTSDPVVLRLAVGAVIDAEVVAAETGAPIAGATVELQRAGITAATDRNGRARLAGTPRGTLIGIRATAPGRAPGGAVVATPDAPGAAVSARIALHAGAPVSGLVVEAGGEPIAEATVTASPAGEPFAGLVRGERALTGADGRFDFPALAPGTYRFEARHRGHLDGGVTRAVAGAIAGLRIELVRGARVSGRVVDASGAPAPWAKVALGPSQPRERAGERYHQRAQADRTGAFALEGVPRRIFSVMAAGDEASSQPVELDLAGGDRDGLLLRLDAGGRLGGIVVDEAGGPIAEAAVTALADFLAGPVSDGQQLGGHATTTTDGDGRFAFRGLPEGKYRLAAARAGADPDPMVGAATATGDLDVRLVIRAPGRLRGRARFADGTAPSTFKVQVGRRAPSPVSSRGGEFAVPEVDPGRQLLVVRGPGFAPATVVVDVAAGAERDVGVVRLDRGRALRGRVLDAGGRPVAGALVVAGGSVRAGARSLAAHPEAMEERMGLRRAMTGGDGRFELVGLEQTDLVIAAEHEPEGRSPAVAVARGERSVDLVLAAAASVHGTVIRNGRPSAGLIMAIQRTPRLMAQVEAHADGAYELSGLAPGDYTITGPMPHHPGEPTASRKVTLEAGQRMQVDLVASAGGAALVVSLRPSGDRPIELAQVVLIDGHVSPTTARELVDLGLDPSSIRAAMPTAGESRFDGLRPGPYSVCVTPMPAEATDPLLAARFFERPERVALHCSPITVAPAPLEQRYTAVVPAMAAP